MSDRRPPGKTRELHPDQLAKLTKDAAVEAVTEADLAAGTQGHTPRVRHETLPDPLTMALLAQAAAVSDDTLQDAGPPIDVESPHPRIKRRSTSS